MPCYAKISKVSYHLKFYLVYASSHNSIPTKWDLFLQSDTHAEIILKRIPYFEEIILLVWAELIAKIAW